MDVPIIRTPRLDLVSMTPRFMEAVLGDRLADAQEELGAALPTNPLGFRAERFLGYRLAQLQRDPGVQRWLARAIVLREDEPAMIGMIGFHGEPGVNEAKAADAVEIGYSIVPERRGHGYATEAVEGLIGSARTVGIRHFVASVAPDNEPSLAIIRKLGFVRTGEHIDDEDGLEYVFELRD
jgi:RimJ/RimL family protein N-acetyltransferase